MARHGRGAAREPGGREFVRARSTGARELPEVLLLRDIEASDTVAEALGVSETW
jgi:hypothetical protein